MAIMVSIDSAVSHPVADHIMASGATTDPSRRTMASTHLADVRALLEEAGIDQVHAPVQAARPSTTMILRCRRRSFRETTA